MKKLISTLKATVLLATLLLLAWSAAPSQSEASVTCEGPGHTCHVIVESRTHHYAEVPAY